MWRIKRQYIQSCQRRLGEEPEFFNPHIKESIDERAAKLLSETGFAHLSLPTKLRPVSSRRRTNVKIRHIDLDFIRATKSPEVPLTIYLRGALAAGWWGWFTYRKQGNRKITMGIRVKDYEELGEMMKRYHMKYSEKISRSEVMKLGYSRFRRLSKKQRDRLLSREKKDRSRGSLRKVSLSLSFERWKIDWNPKVLVPELRASLYYLLRSKKLEGFLS
jgi:hypothetical protein